MKGQHPRPESLSYYFRLEDQIPKIPVAIDRTPCGFRLRARPVEEFL